MAFMDENFMLNSKTAVKLYATAKKQPIHDFHCHLDPQEIYEDKPFTNIVDLWLKGDHYKWRLMRANGIAEKYITGNGTNEEKFKAWAKTVGIAIGNPLFHWSHLEMKEEFGIQEVLNKENWKELYDQMNQYLQDHSLSPRKFIQAANVEFIGTTDHPLDSLEWHKKIEEDETFDTVVAPTFRPDEAFIDHKNFSNFTKNLAEATGVRVENFSSFMQAMGDRIQYFASHGCRASDHSLGKIYYLPASKEELDLIFKKAFNNETLSEKEIIKWQTEVFADLCRLYKENNLVTQVHFGALRSNNTHYYELTGPDTGFDSMVDQPYLAENLNLLLDSLTVKKHLPKMVWYNLNPAYNTVIANTLANFQANEEGIQGKLQFGAAWWFNDTKLGMTDQMDVVAEQGLLANFIGMLTDSRSFLSYQRHDYFRRILANYLAEWVDNEEIPNDNQLLTRVIEDISYNNANNFFKEIT